MLVRYLLQPSNAVLFSGAVLNSAVFSSIINQQPRIPGCEVDKKLIEPPALSICNTSLATAMRMPILDALFVDF